MIFFLDLAACMKTRFFFIIFQCFDENWVLSHPRESAAFRRPFPKRGIMSGSFLCKRKSPSNIMVTRNPNWSSEILKQGTGCVKGRF